MKVTYFAETDTLYVELRPRDIHETREMDENTYMDVDQQGKVCAITIEHASERAELPKVEFQEVAA